MFRVAVVMAFCLAPGVALAQRASVAASPAPSLPQIGLPLPQIGLPLPAIGLPLSPLGLASPAESPRRRDSPPSAGSPRPRASRGHSRGAPAIVYFGFPYLPAYDPPVQPQSPPGLTAAPADLPPAPPTGRLRLDIEPVDGLQIFVDNIFVGALVDIGPELDLPVGVRRLELHAPGHEPLKVAVNIAEARTIAYRGRLHIIESTPQDAAVREPQARVTAPAPPRGQTFYVIPGCYLGNVPPHDARLPASCDPGKAIIYKP